ncbi:manganese-binding transcriptional regulator MntR [Limibaculum sp. M0105]|uniref:Transcriptional regulator MntR n=1 Tax=Thermohalobaculum xanthum TaxID=2753746 RepID=A0A8J7SGP8_9RHOB|nr:manganese-binding transcriptional regulator MntR [Thermohalobaculum xanthum]MBK0400302.1 manganese-binding transcriptional regulator MntR [Thermohalobaculum xanthum]
MPAKRPSPTVLREATRQARSFERVRQAHQREVAEDYVELIADLIDVTGEARAVDLAERLGVTNATVNAALNRLARDGLVTRQRYRSIFLTTEGRRLAEESRARHRIVRDALIKLGVDSETAEIDAEGIEHHISARTLAALREFLEGAGTP